MQRGRIKRLLLFVLVLFLFSACQAWDDRQTVASVNGETVKKKPYRLIYQARYQGMLQNHDALPPGMEQKLAQRIIEEMINDVLYFQEAKKRNLVPSMEEVNKSMGHTAGGKPDAAFQKTLKAKGITMEELRTEMQRRIAINALRGELTKGAVATEQEAREFYKKNRGFFYFPPQYKISMLYAADAAGAEKYREAVQSGKSRFEDLTAQNPPRLAQMTKTQPVWTSAESFSVEIARAIKETGVGKISSPVKGMEGYYLIKIYDRKERRPQSFNEVKDAIIRNLNQEKREIVLADWLAEQKKKAAIEIKESRLKIKMEPPAPAKRERSSEPAPPKAEGKKG